MDEYLFSEEHIKHLDALEKDYRSNYELDEFNISEEQIKI